MTALPEVAQGSLEEGLAKALLPHAQLRLFKGSVALLSAYAAGEINVFAGGGNVLVEVKASGVLMVNAMKCFARAFHLTCSSRCAAAKACHPSIPPAPWRLAGFFSGLARASDPCWGATKWMLALPGYGFLIYVRTILCRAVPAGGAAMRKAAARLPTLPLAAWPHWQGRPCPYARTPSRVLAAPLQNRGASAE